MYGDTEILAEHYDSMLNFVRFCKNRCDSDLKPPSSYHCYGDWLNIDDDTPSDVIYMCYFGYCTQLMADIAAVLEKNDDEANLRNLFNKIKASFNTNYVSSDGMISGDSQAGYVMAIMYNMLDEQYVDMAANHLVRRIQEEDWHLSTGFVGTKDLMLALSEIGRNDIAYMLLHNDTFPSWGYSIKQGATTIWERWNGWTPESGFNDPGMNSFAHYSFGAVCQWIFENIGGIQTDGAGFKDIIIKPEPDNKLKWANTSYMTIHGQVSTSWHVDGTQFHCNVGIPAGTEATVYIVTDNPETVRESGMLAAEADGVTYLSYDGKFAAYKIVSGEYSFVSEIAWKVVSWSSDEDSGISAGKIYTHAVNLNADPSETLIINGVQFENADSRTGSNWELYGTPLSHNSAQTAIDGDSGALINGLFYSEPSQLSLTGLTPGENYVLTQYVRGFGEPFGRVVNISVSHNSTVSIIDQNYYGDQQGALVKYYYTAPASGELLLEYAAEDSADTWHHYAFSNEVYSDAYLDPSPMPGDALEDGQLLSWVCHSSYENVTYNVLISEDPSMEIIVYQKNNITESELNILLGYEKTYYWQVQVLVDSAVVHTSPVWNFVRGEMPEPAENVLCWSFDENSGDIAYQTGSSSGGDGVMLEFANTDFGTSRVYGLSNNAVYFDTDDEYIDISSAGTVISDLAKGDFAFSGYIKTFDDYGPVISMRNLDSETSIVDLAIGANGIHIVPGELCMIARNDNNSYKAVASGVKVNDGLWHSVVFSKKEGLWSLYVDGKKCAEYSLSGNFSLNCLAIGSERKWVIDSWQPDVSYYRYYKGIVDEFSIWSGSLTLAQIYDLTANIPDMSDVNYDLSTDVGDLEILARHWVEGNSADCSHAVNVISGDINFDCNINLTDFGIIADNWLME